MECLGFAGDQLFEVLVAFGDGFLALGELLLLVVEALLLAGQFALLPLGRVLALLGAALQFAQFGAGGVQFLAQLLAAADGVVARLQFGVAHDPLGVAARLLDEFGAARFGAANHFGVGFGFARGRRGARRTTR